MPHTATRPIAFDGLAYPLADRKPAATVSALIAQIAQRDQRMRMAGALFPHLPKSLALAYA